MPCTISVGSGPHSPAPLCARAPVGAPWGCRRAGRRRRALPGARHPSVSPADGDRGRSVPSVDCPAGCGEAGPDPRPAGPLQVIGPRSGISVDQGSRRRHPWVRTRRRRGPTCWRLPAAAEPPRPLAPSGTAAAAEPPMGNRTAPGGTDMGRGRRARDTWASPSATIECPTGARRPPVSPAPGLAWTPRQREPARGPERPQWQIEGAPDPGAP